MSEFPLLRPNAYAGTPGSGRQGAAVAEALPPTPASRPEALSCVATREDYWGEALRRLDATKQNCIQQALEKQQDGSGGSVDVDDAKESRLRLQDRPVITEGSLSWPDILSEVCRRSQRLEDDRTKKRNFRFAGRDVNLRKTLETWVKFFNRIKQIGDIAVNVDPIHAGLPWAAIRLIITAATASSDQNGAIYVGIEKVLFLMNRGAAYEALLAHLRRQLSAEILINFEEALVKLYTCLLEFLASALVVRDKNVFKRAFYAFWTPQDVSSFSENCLELEKTLEIESRLVESQCNRETTDNIETILKASDCLEEVIADTKTLVQALRGEIKEQRHREQEEEENLEALGWVSNIPILDYHDNAKDGRTPYTGQWVFSKPEFRDWESCSGSSLLWIHGIPGAGKTKLVTTIVDYFLQSRQPSQNLTRTTPSADSCAHRPTPSRASEPSPLAFFYCRRADTERRKPENVLRSFLKQLALSHDGSLASLRTVYMDKKRQGFLSNSLNTIECQDLLVKMITQCREAILILDALDECDEESRHDLIAAVNGLVERSIPAKILISSRRDDDITAEFEDRVNFSLSATENHDDIMRFVKDKIKEYRNSKTARRKINSAISTKLEQQIIKVFLDKSNGMFQWAALHLAHLLSLDRPLDIARTLQGLPRGLEKTYGEIFERITSPDNSLRDIAIRTLLWMLSQNGIANVDQTLVIACQDLSNDDINQVDIDIETVIKACQNLIVVENGSDFSAPHNFSTSIPGENEPLSPVPGPPLPIPPVPKAPPSPPPELHGSCTTAYRPRFVSRRKFRFAHLSVQEYCETIQWTQQVAQSFAAKTCLLFLLQPEDQFTAIPYTYRTPPSTPHGPPPPTHPPLIVREFADYFWIYHIQKCWVPGAIPQDERLVALATRFLGFPSKTSEAFDRWLSRFSWHSLSFGYTPTFWSIKRKHPLFSTDYSFRSWAYSHGFGWPGRDGPSKFDFQGQSSLVACFFGLDHIFFPSAEDIITIPALFWDPHWSRPGTTISIFSHFSSPRMLWMMLGPLVKTNAEQANNLLWNLVLSIGNHPLKYIYTWSFPHYFSLCTGAAELVHCLHVRDCFNMCGRIVTHLLRPDFPMYSSYPVAEALQSASKIVSLGANLTVPLRQALEQSRWQNVVWLVEHGAKPDADVLSTILECETYHGYDRFPPADTYKALIDRGADVNAYIYRGEYWVGTPIIAASIHGNSELAQLLVSAGAEVDVIPWAEVGTPSIESETTEEHEFNLYSLSKFKCKKLNGVGAAPFGTALVEASARGHVEICRLLVKHMPDMHADAPLQPGIGKFGTPLIAACAFNRLDICRVLLECHVDVAALSWRVPKFSGPPLTTNALLTAASCGGLEICRLLLRQGADYNVITPPENTAMLRSQGSPLIAAALYGHKEICRLLIDHGAKVDGIALDAKYPTALIAAASRNKWKVCQLLIDYGANVDLLVPNTPYCNALIAACRLRKLRSIEVLIARGAERKIDPSTGEYARQLLAACMGFDVRRAKVMELISSGAALPRLETIELNEEALDIMRGRLTAASSMIGQIDLKKKQDFSQVQDEVQRKVRLLTEDNLLAFSKVNDLRTLLEVIYDPLLLTKKLRRIALQALRRIATRMFDLNPQRLKDLFEKFPTLAADLALAYTEEMANAERD